LPNLIVLPTKFALVPVHRLSRRQSKKSLFCTDDFNIVGVAGDAPGQAQIL
jgi:hypothetical protein